mmetsp:Transcript_15641/g.36624  ORF Transcript_15641/g.36624 Transcript_15641/m.36624 type:complete len:232 (-) Transcript_15641:276-971(-)
MVLRPFIASNHILHPESDGNVITKAANLCARVIFEPVPKTAKGITALQEVICPRLIKNFGVDREVDSGLAVILDDGKLAGMSGVVVDGFPTDVPGVTLPNGKVPRIAYVAVEPSMQRQGLATKLVRKCEDWACARGESEMWVFVDNANTRAYNLYKKLGYIPVKEDIRTNLPTAGQGEEEGTLHMEERILTLSKKELPRWSTWQRALHWVATLCSPLSHSARRSLRGGASA